MNTDGKASEAVTGNETGTAGDFFPEEAAFRNKGTFQRKRTEVFREQNKTGGEAGEVDTHGYGAECKTGRLSRCSVLYKDIFQIRGADPGI